MAESTKPTAVERLVHHLVGDRGDDPVGDDVAAWLARSPRFRRFAEAHRDKIRKKLRGATDSESRRDVRAELGVAYALLGDRRIELDFEAYGSGKVGPDFTVAVRGDRAFNLEVKRLRRAPAPAAVGRALLGKLRQLTPSVPNAVVLAIDDAVAHSVDVAGVARALRARADEKDEAFLADHGFTGTRDFYQLYLRLGAVMVWCEDAAGDGRASLWVNRSARIAIPEPAARACLLRLRA